jgi:hypothetical protein
MITTVNDPVAVDLPLDFTGQELVLFSVAAAILSRFCIPSLETRFGPNDSFVLLMKATQATLAELVDDNATPQERTTISDETLLALKFIEP